MAVHRRSRGCPPFPPGPQQLTAVVFTELQGLHKPPQRKFPKTFSTSPPQVQNDDFSVIRNAGFSFSLMFSLYL